jgi:hypothetical protein
MLTKLLSADQQVAPGQEDMEDIKKYNEEEAELTIYITACDRWLILMPLLVSSVFEPLHGPANSTLYL